MRKSENDTNDEASATEGGAMKTAWIGFCGVGVAFFGGTAIAFIAAAIHFWLNPPSWEIALRADPSLSYLTRGDVPLQLLLACAPLGFALIWGARLYMALKEGR
jgi:hypothetical protein